MFPGQQDFVWLVPLFSAGLLLLASAGLWLRLAYGKDVGGVDVKPNAAHFRLAASITALALGLLGAAILLLFWVRF